MRVFDIFILFLWNLRKAFWTFRWMLRCVGRPYITQWKDPIKYLFAQSYILQNVTLDRVIFSNKIIRIILRKLLIALGIIKFQTATREMDVASVIKRRKTKVPAWRSGLRGKKKRMGEGGNEKDPLSKLRVYVCGEYHHCVHPTTKRKVSLARKEVYTRRFVVERAFRSRWRRE